MIASQGILRARRSIVRQLSAIERQINYVIEAEENLADVRSQLSSLNKQTLIAPRFRQDIAQSVALLDTYTFYDSLKTNTLRDIDRACGIICGFLVPLIDTCIENRDSSLKIWIKNHILELDGIRHIKVLDKDIVIPLPVVSAWLVPYLEETRAREDAYWFITLRNAIRKFLE